MTENAASGRLPLDPRVGPGKGVVRHAGRRGGRPLLAALLMVAATAALVMRFGPAGFALPLGLIALAFPLSNPRLALGLAVGYAILFESSTPNALGFTTDQIHDPLPGHYSELELLLVVATCAVLIDATRRRRIPLRPAPFGPAITLLVLGLLTGALVGHYAGAGFNPITEEIRGVLPLIVVPWVTVNAIRDSKDLRRAITFVAVLTVVKAALGIVGVLSHVGVTASGTTITYYEPAANWLAMTYVLTILASIAGRVPVRRLARWATVLVFLSLALSLRRSFWLGTIAAIPFTVVIVMPPVGRRFLIPAAAVLAAAVWIAVSTGFAIDSQSPVGQRIQSISASRLAANPEDRYRLDERRNVVAAIRGSPLVGLGLAISWKERYPLSVQQPGQGGRTYVHMAVLWFWLKLGVAGLIGYVTYLLTGIVVGARVFHQHHDALIRVAAAGAAATLAGMAVVETTATFLGAESRTTVLAGGMAGLLAVGLMECRAVAAKRGQQPTDERVRSYVPPPRTASSST